MPKTDDEPESYDVNPLSNYEGYKRLDKSLEKIETKVKGREKLCEICGRRTLAWRMVPATFGRVTGRHKPLSNGTVGAHPFAGRKMVLACDANEDGCAAGLIRAGVDKTAVEHDAIIRRLGLVQVS